MNYKSLNLWLIMVASLLLAAPGYAGDKDHKERGHCPHEKHKNHKGMGHKFEALNLSDSQKQQIEAIKETQRPIIKEQKLALRKVSKEIHELTSVSNYDPAQLDVLATRKGEIVAALTKLKVEKKSKIRAVLTPEQQTQLSEMRMKHKFKHMKDDKK